MGFALYLSPALCPRKSQSWTLTLEQPARVVLPTATRCVLVCRHLQRWAAPLSPWVSRDDTLVIAVSARGVHMWVFSCAVAQCLGFICWDFSKQPAMSFFSFFFMGCCFSVLQAGPASCTLTFCSASGQHSPCPCF